MVDAQTYDKTSLQTLKQEVQTLSRMSHPNIIKYLGAYLSPPHICIVEELAEGGSLHARLHGRDARGIKLHPQMSLPEVLQLGCDVAAAMAYLHPRCVHRDLKPQNVLLDRHGRAKVADFGLAKMKDQTCMSTRNVNVGTPAFMAPEQFEGGAVSEKVDVYAFGVLMWEALTGEQAWADLDHPMQIIFHVGVQCARPDIPHDGFPPLVQLIEACWHDSPAARPPFTAALAALTEMAAGVDSH
ncbi:hypothetical protein FOA52_002063 [Chlamydomonas sp. UWO 241]|nr:hypothetical protein FOA52_002063 [Chlamydomonas sp. UWO 241]